MKKHPLVKDLENNVYCRLKPSPIQGIGVFAIRKIPKGINPFKSFSKDEFEGLKSSEVFKNKNITKEVKKLVNDVYITYKDIVYLKTTGINSINIGFFVNHSNKPNLRIGDDDEFYALREIKIGEELTLDYTEWGTDWENF